MNSTLIPDSEVRSKIIQTVARRLANDYKSTSFSAMRERAPYALKWLCTTHSEPRAFVDALSEAQLKSLLGACALYATKKAAAMVYRAARLGIDLPEYDGFVDGRLWNGFDMPLFELPVAFAIMNKACCSGSDLSYTYHPATGDFTMTDEQYPDDPYIFGMERFTDATGVSRLGWGIGAGYWTWSADNDAE